MLGKNGKAYLRSMRSMLYATNNILSWGTQTSKCNELQPTKPELDKGFRAGPQKPSSSTSSSDWIDHITMGQNPVQPLNIPIPTKTIRLNWVVHKSLKMGSQNGFDQPHPAWNRVRFSWCFTCASWQLPRQRPRRIATRASNASLRGASGLGGGSGVAWLTLG